ncbi:type I 3-dehydroquinate dehydratase [Virgibacillus xinjiangensis]|uniref:3-dehydroquinate dehydratase n=1 Tax=Virgibacillus xinjiangensis TaxID=393090 RepID=A0ABV7CYZ3_9BACI
MSVVKIRNLTIGEGSPKVIVPLMGKTSEELVEEVQVVKELNPDMVEWRADVYERLEYMEEVGRTADELRMALGEVPLLFTFRTHKEGGSREWSETEYFELLSRMVDSCRVDMIDVEYYSDEQQVKNIIQQAGEKGVRVILSNHDFGGTPTMEEIVQRLKGMQEMGADIAKIAVMPRSMDDLFTLLHATNRMKENYANRPLITMAMGKLGLISRLAGEVFGSAATFGAGKEASAPGQIAVDDLKDVLTVIHKYQYR